MATYLIEMTRRHVAYPPALIGHRLSDLLQKLLLHFRRRELRSDCNEILHGQKPYRILIVRLELPVYGQAIRQNVCLCELLRQGL